MPTSNSGGVLVFVEFVMDIDPNENLTKLKFFDKWIWNVKVAGELTCWAYFELYNIGIQIIFWSWSFYAPNLWTNLDILNDASKEVVQFINADIVCMFLCGWIKLKHMLMKGFWLTNLSWSFHVYLSSSASVPYGLYGSFGM